MSATKTKQKNQSRMPKLPSHVPNPRETYWEDVPEDIQAEIKALKKRCLEKFQDLKEALELCAEQFETYDPGQPGRKIHPRIPQWSDVESANQAWKEFRDEVLAKARGKDVTGRWVALLVFEFYVYRHPGWKAREVANNRAWAASEEGRKKARERLQQWRANGGAERRREAESTPEFRAKEAERKRIARAEAKARRADLDIILGAV
jgi:hypothetical protein